MKPVSQTPTEPTDYALLSGTFSALLALSAAAARNRDPIAPSEYLPLATATFALSKLLVHEKVETWVRQPFVEETEDGKRPKGRGLRYAVGELLTCTRCSGAWSALALVSLRSHSPEIARTVTTVLTVSAGNDFLHSGFTWLASRTNIETARADAAQSA
jgi:hypothetical protein